MEDTTKTMDTTQDKLIEEMVADAKGTPRNVGNPVINAGSETPSIIHVEDGGLVLLYDKVTGRELSVLKYMLTELLKAKNPDGTSRFTTTKPGVTIKRGVLKCLLHPDGANRGHYDELGLPVCRKSNITAPYMVDQHMRKRHPSAWAVIEQEKKDAEKKEDREFQRSLLSRGAVESEVPPLYISDKDKKKK
jgi:hypothetical protein